MAEKMTKEEWYNQLFLGLGRSKFRSSFLLKQKDIDYINEKGLDTIREHAREFIAKREAPAVIPNDGKQTPMKGHPVFVAILNAPSLKGSKLNSSPLFLVPSGKIKIEIPFLTYSMAFKIVFNPSFAFSRSKKRQ